MGVRVVVVVSDSGDSGSGSGVVKIADRVSSTSPFTLSIFFFSGHIITNTWRVEVFMHMASIDYGCMSAC